MTKSLHSFHMKAFPEVGLLDSMEESTQFPQSLHTVFPSGCTIYTRTNSPRGFPFLCILASQYLSLVFLVIVIQTGVR